MKSTRIGHRFVPQSTIDRRVQQKDDRLAAELRRRSARVRHYMPYDSSGVALCGAICLRDECSPEPTCDACRTALAADSRHLADLEGGR